MNPKVLLVYPPNQLMGEETPRPDGSLGPLYLAGALRNAGFEVVVLDASVGAPEDKAEDTFFRMVKQPNGLVRIGMSEERIREFIAAGNFQIVGINSNFTPQTKMALEVAEAAKSVNPQTLVIAGGVNARGLASRILQSGLIDLICTTEGEKIIVKIAQIWKPGQIPRNIPGTIFMHQGQIVFNPPKGDTIYANTDDRPMPAWELLPFEKYDIILAPHADPSVRHLGRSAPIITSVGCPFECVYCHISTEKAEPEYSGDIGGLRLSSVDRVMAELDVLASLRVSHLYFEDDSLLAKKRRVREIFEKVVGRGFTIANVNGVNLVHFMVKGKGHKLEVDREYLQLLKDAGFSTIVFPVESASQRILDKYATGKLDHSKMDVIELVRIAREVGIVCPINMMVGFPDETEAEILASIELGKRLVDAGAHYCTLFIPIPFPGSQLFDYAIRHNHLSLDFDPDMMNWKRPVMKNTIVSPERVLELRDWGWHYMNRDEYVAKRLASNLSARIAQ